MAVQSPFDWNDIPILIALAHSGSMRTAGKRLGITTSTVSRRLVAAEKALQTRLFLRAPGGYKPTDAGRLFLAQAEDIETRVHTLLLETNRESATVKGPVRITSVDVVLYDWLIPRAPELRALHPGLEVRIVSDNHVLSFTRGEADLAIRIARPREDAAISMRRIGTIGMAVYASPQLRRPSRSRWGELPWIRFDEDLSDAVEMKWLDKNVPTAQTMFRCSSMSGLIAACESGMGAALLPSFATRDKKLVKLSTGPEFQRDIYLLSHRQGGKIRRFRAVADWIGQTAARDADLLSGR